MRLEVETDLPGVRLFVAAGIASLVAIGVYFVGGMWLAFLAWIFGGGFVWAMGGMIAMRKISSEAKEASQKAVDAFHAAHPDEAVGSVALRAVEDDRYVFSIRFGSGRPTARKYYVVSKETLDATESDDQRAYWPRGLR